jgi:site-specific DNA-methyltransferase (adenine-specific)
MFAVELSENVHRENLSWQDRAAAYAELHTMRLSENPAQTLVDTKKELIEMGAPMKLTTNASEIREAQVIADHLDDPKIANARNAREALQLIYKKEEEKIQAVLVKRQLLTLTEKPSIEIRHGDLLTILPNLSPSQFDLVCADPPYGIGASSGGFRQRTVHHHNYEDTPANAQTIAQCILTEGFRLTKPRANLFIFCDIDLFGWLRDAAANMGWTPFRRPLIWQKSESEGMAPWGSLGPRITTEFIFYATKGQRGMTASPVDWFAEKRVPRNERLHAAEKPVDLLKRLIELTTLPGDRILDPCCGSGSALVAAKELQRGGLGIEQDETYFNTALVNVHSKEFA